MPFGAVGFLEEVAVFGEGRLMAVENAVSAHFSILDFRLTARFLGNHFNQRYSANLRFIRFSRFTLVLALRQYVFAWRRAAPRRQHFARPN